MSRNNDQLKDKQADGIGARLPRKEDIPILRGEGQYFSDIAVERQLHVMFLRSVHAHARILSIDTSAASQMPGVVAVVTGAMLQEEILPLPQASTSAGLPGRLPTFWPLAVDKVKFHGEPVAAVVAEAPYLAEDALEGITVEYEPLPYVGDMEAALEPSSPLVGTITRFSDLTIRRSGRRMSTRLTSKRLGAGSLRHRL
jgi:carbon-monoxide dehydrogenase large subunit